MLSPSGARGENKKSLINGESLALSQAEMVARPTLARSLSLVHANLYGLSVTIGAGIYVLIGAAAACAGMHAALAFGIAAVLMALSAASFAELACRFPSPRVRPRTHGRRLSLR